VHAGDVLVTIDPQGTLRSRCIRPRRHSRTRWPAPQVLASTCRSPPLRRKSNLDSAGTAVVNAQAGLKAAEQNFESAKSGLGAGRKQIRRRPTRTVRYEKLVAKEEISRQQYDGAVAAAAANRAAVASATAGVQAAEEAVRQAQGKLCRQATICGALRLPLAGLLIRSRADAADALVLQRKRSSLKQNPISAIQSFVHQSQELSARRQSKWARRQYRAGIGTSGAA